MRRRCILALPFAAWLTGAPAAERLLTPIAGLKLADLHDSFDETHAGGRHDAMDIAAPRGTPVRAMTTGTIRKLFLSQPGGKTIYLFDEQEQFCYYYAHLDAYSPCLREGMKVKRGDELGYVGSTGNADPRAPHLHLAVMALNERKEWWRGVYLNPYPLLVETLRHPVE